MPRGEVHWHEGMFLRQHHFLTEHRQLVKLMQLDEKWTVHHNWGLRSIQLNTDALGNFRFSVGELKARLRDGTLIEVPEDGPLPELDLKPALEANRKVTIYLGVPLLQSSHPNVATEGPSDNHALLRDHPAGGRREPGRQSAAARLPPAEPQAPCCRPRTSPDTRRSRWLGWRSRIGPRRRRSSIPASSRRYWPATPGRSSR